MTTTPGGTVTGAELRRAVLQQLDRLDSTTTTGTDAVLLPVARDELNRLVSGWLELLDQHTPDDDGRCAHCRGLLRRAVWPCAVWRAAHTQLIGPHPTPDPAGPAMPGPEAPTPAGPDPWTPPEADPTTGGAADEGTAGVDWAAVAERVARMRRRG